MISAVKQLNSYLQAMHISHNIDEDADYLENWSETMERVFYNSITLIRCTVHTLKLAVTDVIKSHDIRSCSAVAKSCRKIHYMSVFELLKQ